MTRLDADLLRMRCETFGRRPVGFCRVGVRIYFGRLALAVEAYGDQTPSQLELLPYFTPEVIANQQFELVAGGYSRRQVSAFLRSLAEELGDRPGRVVDVRVARSTDQSANQCH